MKVWEGESLINGASIMVCITGLNPKAPSQNRKTGPLSHAWVLPLDEPMQVAVKSGSDAAVCGDCPRRRSLRNPPADWSPRQSWEVDCAGRCSDCLRCSPRKWGSAMRPSGIVIEAHGIHKRACFSVPWQVPKMLHERFARRDVVSVTEARKRQLAVKRPLRITQIGDPAAVPLDVWRRLVPKKLWGPTHTQRWRVCDQAWRDYAMASVNTLEEADEAQRMGWRTYRVRMEE